MTDKNYSYELGKNNGGFTLIELMIVVGIIGILAAIAIPSFSSYRARSYDAAAVSHLKFMETGEHHHWVDSQLYMAIPAGDGPGPTGFLPNTSVPNGVGYVAGAFPNRGTDPQTGYTVGDDFVAFTGHFRGNRFFGVDTRGVLQWKLPAAGQDPATAAKSANIAQLLPNGWGSPL